MTDLCVVVFSHNHEKFIRQAVISVFQQKTSKKIRILAIDDASEDRTALILRRLARESPFSMSVVVHDRNRYLEGPSFKLEALRQVGATYAAVLDGDDLWTDSSKLELQALALDRNPTAAMSNHLFSGLHPSGAITPFYPRPSVRSGMISGDEFASGNFVGTSTAVVRVESLNRPFPDGYEKCLGVDDYPIWSLICESKFIVGINRDMALYRIHDGQMYNQQSRETKLAQLRVAQDYILKGLSEEKKRLFGRAFSRF